MRWLRTPRGILTCAALVAGALLLDAAPGYAGPHGVTVLFTLLTFIALAQSWNLVGGFGGQFSLGNSLFVGTGAYGTGMLLLHTDLPLFAVVVLGGLMAAVLAVVVAVALVRLRGIYFSVGSLAASLAGLAWMVNWDYTGANQGLNLPPGDLVAQDTLFRAALVVAILVTLVALAARFTAWGLRVQAVRDDEGAAAGAGTSPAYTKMGMFAISAFFTGLTGGLLALQQISITPESMFGIGWTTNMIVMAVIGGIGTVIGPILGATAVYYGIQQQLETHPEVGALVTGLLLVAVVRFFPGGLADVLVKLTRGGWRWLAPRRLDSEV